MENEPLVSIITPTYNRGYILPQAINSIINQTYQNWELLIIDDRSTDNTREVVSKLIESDKRIRYLLNSRKKGPAGARNHGILNSKGEYIAFLDSDDQWFPHHLTDAIRVLTTEKVSLCFALWHEMHSGEALKMGDIPYTKEMVDNTVAILNSTVKDNLYFFGEGFYDLAVQERVFFYHINTLVAHKSIFQKIGLLNEKLFTTEDTDLFLRAFHDYEFCLIYDHHALYNEGNDTLYSFYDRFKLFKLDVNEISTNKKIIEKLNFQGKNKILMRKMHRNFVLKSDKIKNKKVYIRYLNKLIAKKYLFLGLINWKTHKVKSIYYYIKSFYHIFDLISSNPSNYDIF